MNRLWIVFLALLGAAVVLSAAAIPCRACDRSLPLAWIGMAGYGALLAVAIWRGPGRIVFGGVFLALGVHALLVFRMVQTGWCAVCLAAAANALLLGITSLLIDRRNWAVAGTFLPLSALALFILPRPAPVVLRDVAVESHGGAVRLLILERPDCPYCEELRVNLVPRLAAKYGPRLDIKFRSADDFPGIQRTPTLILSRDRRTRVIEGLPPYETLARAVEETMGGRP